MIPVKDIILKAENISKQYRLGQVGTGTLSHDLNRWWHQVRGKEDPYLKIGDTNDRSTKGSSDYVWALQDINFEVERGEVLGIIGKNGAGKSTLLKILSKVTAPTTGSIKSRGRIASLLEVGTGFNGEMTGRENIFLNGAILGMTKKEIASKLDEIIEFSGCERYIDTPVKRYSSGMTVRLAFAVAAFLEPEILVIDEVLAVGDAEFQKKAIGKMQDISREGGRTVLFVSHNMAAVSSLCTKGIFMKNGRIHKTGSMQEIIDIYINDGQETLAVKQGRDIEYKQKCPYAHFNSIKIISENEMKSDVKIDKEIHIEIEYTITVEKIVLCPSIHLLDNLGTCIFATFNGSSASLTFDLFFGKELKQGKYKTVCTIPANFLNESTYKINAFLVPPNSAEMAIAEEVLSFNVNETGTMTKEYTGPWIGQIRPKLAWRTEVII
jgi:lipopolysaccharide transport system ATP-binding protein